MTKDEALKLALEALLWANKEINGWRDDAYGYEPEDQPEIMSAITAIKEALAQPEQEPEVDLRTRWPMNKWKENKPTPPQQEPWNEDEWRKNNWRCKHGWLRGEQCEICNAAQEPVACLDCGSPNIGIAATYESLINSVKTQPEQEPMHPELRKMWEDYFDKCFRAMPLPEYTTPPQRTWVGLTDEEREEIALEVPIDAVFITEAKLRSKNEH